MRALLKAFQDDESGATAIEYGRIATLITLTIIASTSMLGGEVKSTFEFVEGKVIGATRPSDR